MDEDNTEHWKRPKSVHFPSIWQRFEGNKSGRLYWIQDITDEYVDKIVDTLADDFTKELFGGWFESSKDRDRVDEMKEIWKDCLNQRVGIMCLTKDSQEKEVLVGFNATYVNAKNGAKLKRLLTDERVVGVLNYIQTSRDAFEELNVNEYIGALGLFVYPDFRGDSVGTELLKAREPLAKAFGIKASLTLFTSTPGQKAAEKAGFKDFFTVDTDELVKINPSFRFSDNPETKTLRLMYMLY